jgi:hypothetical protein
MITTRFTALCGHQDTVVLPDDVTDSAILSLVNQPCQECVHEALHNSDCTFKVVDEDALFTAEDLYFLARAGAL